ncbi:MAG: oxygenase MpaB family protein [Nocardioides sp.]|nr:oxygenase MpaB family protein [Nocardioides sp.]
MTTTADIRRTPARFRAGEARAARIGRPLRLVGGVRRVDEVLMTRIGKALTERDEPGAALADAMRLRAGTPGRVSMADFRTALADGAEAVRDAPAALRDFFAVVEEVPAWVDWEVLEQGAAVYRRFGQNAADVLLQLSLVGGYRFGGPPDLLVATGGLTGGTARRRLAETQTWTTSLSEPGALRRDGEGWRLTVHVRAMHALVNAAFERSDRWDVDRWGLPINQADQAATLGLFDAAVLLGVRTLGVPVSTADSRAVMHLWRYVGWLLGVDEQWLVTSERDRHRLNYHLLRAQDDVTPAGPELAGAIVGVLRGQRHGRFRAERALSMLTVLLGRRSMHDLGLTVRPPWALAYLWPLNTWRYRLLGRTPVGRRRLEAWGRRVIDRTARDHFGDAPPTVGPLRAE